MPEPALARDAALGSTLQGDLHLVIVDAKKISDPDNYSNALVAYWLSPKFGKDALSKNGIVVVLGTSDGKTVDYTYAAGADLLTGQTVGHNQSLSLKPWDLAIVEESGANR